MWQVREVRTAVVRRQLTADGDRWREAAEVELDGVRFANDAGSGSWAEAEFQALVCEACGHPGCAAGNYLAARRLGDHAAFLPAFASLEDSVVPDQYRPPGYLEERGAALLDADRYAELRAAAPALPELEALRAISRAEFVRLLQWEAPAAVLGHRFEAVALRRSLILATDADDETSRVDDLARLLQAKGEGEVVGLPAGGVPVTCTLDTSEWVAWRPLALVDGTPCLFLEPGFVLR